MGITGVCDGEIVEVNAGIEVLVAASRLEVVAIISGDGEVFSEDPQEASKKTNRSR